MTDLQVSGRNVTVSGAGDTVIWFNAFVLVIEKEHCTYKRGAKPLSNRILFSLSAKRI